MSFTARVPSQAASQQMMEAILQHTEDRIKAPSAPLHSALNLVQDVARGLFSILDLDDELSNYCHRPSSPHDAVGWEAWHAIQAVRCIARLHSVYP